MKPSNKIKSEIAEVVEGRDRPKGNPHEKARGRTQSRRTLPPSLLRVNEAAKRDKHLRFNALLHHVNVASLQDAFYRLRRSASPGVDGETFESYAQALQSRLQNLCERIHTGRYEPQPVRRVYIPKASGGLRPLGVTALEDKIVQGAVAQVLSAVYEADFLGFSYGFRPGRGPHDALRALHQALMSQRVNWVLDADVRSFFDSVDHEWMLRILAHRIADRRILRLIQQWLTAGVLEGKDWKESEWGIPQGAGISPLLANVFLHYVLDLWVQQWRQRFARGRVIIVRFADDFVLGFQCEEDGRRMHMALSQRLNNFGLMLHEQKTRLIEFGKFVSERRQRQGQPCCPTFAFLGFTHYCGRSREGRFVVKRKTESRRLSRKLKEVYATAKRRMHTSLGEQHAWLASVLRGHYAYYGVPSNYHSLHIFYLRVCRIWYRVLHRRGQKHPITWSRFSQLLAHFALPTPRIVHAR